MGHYVIPKTPRTFKMFINGDWTDSKTGQTVIRLSPSHNTPVTIIPQGNGDDVNMAVQSARNALHAGWADTPVAIKADILYTCADLIAKRQEEIALLETLENGKTIEQSLGEVSGAVNQWRFAAGAGRGVHGASHNNIGDNLLGVTLREPVGVVGLITPWNFPFFILAERLPYILMSGSTCVIKPSEATSATTLIMAEILQQAGLPDGVVNVITGKGSTAGQAILDHPDIDMISFTGSTDVGRKVIESSAKNIKKIGLELGGKNPQVVFADADIDAAVDGVAFGLCINSGQCCVSGSRLFVEQSIMDVFTKKLIHKISKLKIGNPLDTETQLGAITTDAQFETIMDYIKRGVEQGATLLYGGKTLTDADGNGHYVQPTIFGDCTFAMDIMNQEIFGPVLCIMPFDSFEDAITYANTTEYGLGASIWTKDVDKALIASRKITAGRIWVNTTLAGGPEMPFGGLKQSGLGTECGLFGTEEYTVLKAVHIHLGERDAIYN